jgi:hypothetical protein
MNSLLDDFIKSVANNKFTDREWKNELMRFYADIKTKTTLEVVKRNLRWKRKNEQREALEEQRDYSSLMESFNDKAAINHKKLRKLYYKYKYEKKGNGGN